MKQHVFLATFARLGTVQAACMESRVPRRSVYNWLERDEAFAREFEQSRDAAADVVEAECRRRAVEGIPDPVYFQGRVVGSVQRYSDACLLALLNAYRPERFKHRHELSGRDGRPLATVHVSYDVNMKLDDMPSTPTMPRASAETTEAEGGGSRGR